MEKVSTPYQVFNLLEKFINKKPNLDPADYGCHPEQLAYSSKEQKNTAWRSMRSENKEISADGTRARRALKEARSYPPNLGMLKDAFRHAFSGRLTLEIAPCTCQPCEQCMALTVCGVCHRCTRHGNHIENCPGCPEGNVSLNYCTGQYYPTEYRKAAAAVLECYNHDARPKFTPPDGKLFTTISEIKQASYNVGSHYFDRSTMRFFRSRVLDQVFHGPGGVYFVTSEKGPNEIRAYTVRQFDPKTADINTFGEFNVLSRDRAIRLARVAAEYPEAAKEAMQT